MPTRLITNVLLRRWPLPDPAKSGSKEHRGRALIIAGAVEMPGAAILAATAALRAGCGKVRVAAPEPAALALASAVPELFVLPIAPSGKRRKKTLRSVIDSSGATDSILIGPGMRDTAAIRFLLPQLFRLDSLRALIFDATALRILSTLSRRSLPKADRRCPLILTPHHSEAATLCDVAPEKIERDPLRYAREIAQRFHAVVVLKGAETIICSSNTRAEAFENKRGNIGLATAGSGDVLAGVIAGLTARGTDLLQAAVWAVALHARAGERLAKKMGPIGYLARELAAQIPPLLARSGS